MLNRTSGTLDRAMGRQIFGKDAEGYDAVRMSYPGALYDRVFERAGPTEDLSMFEVGPGTGLATRDILVRRPARLLAIEPDPVLADHLAARFPSQLEIEIGGIEETRAESGAFHLGVAAASFHWVDPAGGMNQVRRLLRSGGCWAMWWNVYRSGGVGDSFADRVIPLLRGLALPPSELAGGHVSLDIAHQEKLLCEAGFGDIAFALYRRERTLDAEGMRALYASYSFVRALAAEERERFLDQVAALVDEEFCGAAPNVVLTPLYIARAP